MLVTRAMFVIGSGGCTVTFRHLSTKIISAYLAGLTLRLLARDHNSTTLSNYDSRLLALMAGMTMSNNIFKYADDTTLLVPEKSDICLEMEFNNC